MMYKWLKIYLNGAQMKPCQVVFGLNWHWPAPYSLHELVFVLTLGVWVRFCCIVAKKQVICPHEVLTQCINLGPPNGSVLYSTCMCGFISLVCCLTDTLYSLRWNYVGTSTCIWISFFRSYMWWFIFITTIY